MIRTMVAIWVAWLASACAASGGSAFGPAPAGTPPEVTIGVPVGELTEARTWYAAVIGRGVETVEPVEGIFEFRIAERAWLQLMQVEAGTAPSPTVVRLATADIESEARRLAAAGIDIGKIEVVPEVVAYAEFRDPFGNAVGLYQVLGPPPLGAGASPP